MFLFVGFISPVHAPNITLNLINVFYPVNFYLYYVSSPPDSCGISESLFYNTPVNLYIVPKFFQYDQGHKRKDGGGIFLS